MTGEDTRADAVLAALERANPLADGRELEGPGSPRARALAAAITGERGSETWPADSSSQRLHDHVRLEMLDRVAVVRFDDGKANLLSREVLDALEEAVELCEEADEVGALLIIGRPMYFSAGLDRRIFLGSPDAVAPLLSKVARLATRIYGSKLPVVTACTGNAIAAGALLLLAADLRVAVRGDYKIGLNETAIGLPLPGWASALARERLAREHYQRATLMAHLYSPDEALPAGFVDQVVDSDDLLAAALRGAEELAALDPEAYAATARVTRADAIARLEAFIESDFGGVRDSGSR
jgi:enoyl-CoA hydratase